MKECILYDSMDMKAQNRQIYFGKKKIEMVVTSLQGHCLCHEVMLSSFMSFAYTSVCITQNSVNVHFVHFFACKFHIQRKTIVKILTSG